MARRTGTEPTQVPSTSKAERRISVFVFDFREMNDFSLGPLKRIFYTVFRTKNHNQNSFRPRNLAPARHGFPLQGTEPTECAHDERHRRGREVGRPRQPRGLRFGATGGVDEDHKRKALLSSSVSTKLERLVAFPFSGKRTCRCGEALARGGGREDVARARGLGRIVDLGPGASRSQG